jgi:hypothetical protein
MVAATDTGDQSHAAVIRVLATVCDTAAIFVLAFLVLSRLFYARFHLSREFEFDRVALIVIAIGLLFVARLARRLNPRLLLAATIGLVVTAVGLAGLIVGSIDVANAVKQAGMHFVLRQHLPDIAAPDERFGYHLRPNARDHQREPDYDVTYTVDASGRRVTPTPERPRATVAFVGDSFTFGDGVEDNQTYSWLLGAEHWHDVKVIDAGVSGWGITQAYLTISDLLDTKPSPSVFVYQMIPDDIYRSYLRSPVTTGVTRRLEFVDGRFEMRNAPTTSPAITPELVEREIGLAVDLIRGMHRMCEQHGVPFAVLLLQDQGNYPASLTYALGEDRITVVDLTRLRYERFTHDYHPNAADHRRIADAIDASAIRHLVDAAVQ